ncbi:winged helix DNA-binding domain-containing protein [Nocardioides pocheonensis]|uniref:Winged helix DNA-binding domain-containing protein n=1 Tax=Nocardioides pocheonensis TaxID=661485 RepID=A0A3N0GNQ9_9ACTN|nr:winged helix DNA-binding domain-containing protein [Nocardioides pocheonensis]RNM13788.1 winged helix DNA-binding domain-containing protein [Nocardioides pocheonensis]
MLLIPDDQRRTRLARRHRLAAPAGSVVEATRAMTCLHATEPASVHLAAFARCRASVAEIDQALYEDRSVVKQLAMRRTVFAFPRELLPAVWGSAAARVAVQQRKRLAGDVEKAGITRDGPRWVEETTAAVLAALHEQGPMTTTELRAALPALEARIVVSPGKTYGGEFPIAPRVLTTLAASGSIVRGDNDGGWKTSRPRWTVATDWVDVGPPLTEAAGYAALVTSWLRTFGPGTETDLTWWLGATKSAVRRALAEVEAVEVRLAQGTGWVLPDDLDDEEPVDPWAALLPALDPTTMGWKERAFYLGDHAERLFDANGNGGPTAWWDGRIVGGWTQREDGSVVVVPAEPLDATAMRALDAEAESLTEWLGGDVVKSIYQSPLARAAG